jgi:hypothetical protein
MHGDPFGYGHRQGKKSRSEHDAVGESPLICKLIRGSSFGV